jgi:hypothetical protein
MCKVFPGRVRSKCTSFAITLNRCQKSRDKIGEMIGLNYLTSLDIIKTREINEELFLKIKTLILIAPVCREDGIMKIILFKLFTNYKNFRTNGDRGL